MEKIGMLKYFTIRAIAKKSFLSFLLLVVGFSVFPQDFQISQPVLQFDGTFLSVYYNIYDPEEARYLVTLEIRNNKGDPLKTESVWGDVGGLIETGVNKKITWYPVQDSVFINGEINVEVIAERYSKSFNKTSAFFLSVLFPGAGQTKMTEGKPWWLMGLAACSIFAGGYLSRENYIKTLSLYRTEDSPVKRNELFQKAEKELKQTNALYITGSAIWSINILSVLITPNRYEPAKDLSISLNRISVPGISSNGISFNIKF